MTYENEVEAGAQWLDDFNPGWHSRIDLERLKLQSCQRCVLGQLYDDFWVAINGKTTDMDYDLAVVRGFTVDFDKLNLTDSILTKTWAELDEFWITQIEKRLANDGKML